MLILAIDTALEACAVAILDTEANSLRAQESQAMARGHAEALMPMIDRVMKAAELSFEALDRIAVTVGPGSFTGLRVGISAARGLGLAAAKTVVGVTTLSAYAAPLLSESGGPIVSLIDARHDHVYMQVVGADGTALVRPRVAPMTDVFDSVQFGAPRLIGNAARMAAERWPGDASAPAGVEQQPAPDITWVAWLGAAADPETSKPRPLYLRAVDAKPQAATTPTEPVLSASP
jgi:tRNA threonylcarbamoyladenosine biosynthesis protein TsaB